MHLKRTQLDINLPVIVQHARTQPVIAMPGVIMVAINYTSLAEVTPPLCTVSSSP
jgi:hypothetical protein